MIRPFDGGNADKRDRKTTTIIITAAAAATAAATESVSCTVWSSGWKLH